MPTIEPEYPGIAEDMFQLVFDMLKGFDNIERQLERISNPTEFPENRYLI